MKSSLLNMSAKITDAHCLLTWRTPLGIMRATLTRRGVRSLHFPEPGGLLLPGACQAYDPVLLLLESFEGKEALDEGCQETADELTGFLLDYFSGSQTARSPRLDWSGHGEFDRAVWKATARIPLGQTQTYGEVAAAIGHPAASRAVGGALGRNPLPLLVPCHRVISKASGPRHWGGFSGGLDLKKWLLTYEAKILHPG